MGSSAVILFGAGATRGAFVNSVPPPPVDRDFFEIAGQLNGRGTRRLAMRVIKDVFSLYNRVNGIGLEQYYRDVETRAEIGKFAKSKNKPMDWLRRQTDLEELIRRVILHTTCDSADGSAHVSASKLHKEVLKHVREGDTLITFNYDTVIEESLGSSAPTWTPGDGYSLDASGKTRGWAKSFVENRNLRHGESSQVHLLKLHGSLNWTLYKNNKVRLKPRPYVVRARRGAPVSDKCSILPPGWHKRIDVNPYRQLWRTARLKMESCSALAIIGYSLPDTDLLARALFAEISRLRAARKHYLKHLYLADPDDTVRERLLNVFVPALGPMGRVYRYKDIEEFSRATGWPNRRS